VLDLFSAAAGGWSLGLHRAGFETVAACEVIDWRRALYAQNNPGVLLYDDVRTLSGARILADLGFLPDIVVGSPPCQDISTANTRGRGVEGERSGLYFEAVRLVRECGPRWFAFENSANLRTRGADAVLAALEGLGYACWPLVVRAGDVGANHQRPRSWLVGCDLAQIADADGRELREQSWRRSRASGRGAAVAETASSAHTAEIGRLAWAGDGEGEEAGRDRRVSYHDADHRCPRNPPDADEARFADGCVEPGLRSQEIADDGRGARRGDDGSGIGEVAICTADREPAEGARLHWGLGDLARHLRLDDGLSAWVAGTRIAVGGRTGGAAASLLVEAFGDSVVPQIPEAIGRAILAVEAALAAETRELAA
jgi:DNA (cytosine-5)-methyltransferase 1